MSYFYEAGPSLLYRYPSGATFPAYVPSTERWQERSTVKRVKPADLLASMTPYRASEMKVDRSQVTFDSGYMAPASDYIGAGPGVGQVVTEMEIAKSRAASNLRMSIKDMTWNAATTAGELGQTLSFLVSCSRDLGRAYSLARKGDLLGLSDLYHKYDYRGKRRKPAYRRVNNAYLQWRYAVRPLVHDLDDMLHELYRSRVVPRVIKARGSATENVYKILQQDNPGTGNRLVIRTGTVRCKYVFYYRETGLASWTHLGWTNLPALLWELTPYSFVVDRFLPIGTYLSGLDALTGVEILNGYLVTKYDFVVSGTFRDGRVIASTREYNREVVTSIPDQPLPGWQVPARGLPEFVLDALALLTQVVTGKR